MNDSESPEARAHYWQVQIDAWRTAGQSQHAFCEANALNYARFGYWLRKFRRQDTVATVPREASGFVPIVASSTGSGLVVSLPSGIELRGVSEQNLPLVEQLLARL